MVLLEPERDVVAADAAEAVELRSLAERNRATRVEPVAADAEAQVLAVADGREIGNLARRRKQRDLRIAEPERRESP